MTHRAHRFMEANKQSPVVYGSAITDPKKLNAEGHPIPQGCFYRLADNKRFELNVEECRLVGAPRWVFEDAA